MSIFSTLRTRTWLLATVVIALALLPLLGRSQSQGGDFVIQKSTIDNGGGVSTGGAFAISGTIAQPEARSEASAGGVFRVRAGFWATADPEELFKDGFED